MKLNPRRIFSHCLVITVIAGGLLGSVGVSAKATPIPTPNDLRPLYAHFHYTSALAANESEVAIKLLTNAIKLDSQLYWAVFRRGVHHLAHRNLNEARRDFETVLSALPTSVYAHYNLACTHALSARKSEAVKHLRRAFELGYRKVDSVRKDADLASIADHTALQKLLSDYLQAPKPDLDSVMQFQLASANQRLEQLNGMLVRRSLPEDIHVAELASLDHSHHVRALSMVLLARIGSPDALRLLLRGIYDSNGNVAKSAANLIIERGPEAEAAILWVLDNDEIMERALSLAMQVLAHTGSKRAVQKIQPFLKHDRMFLRITCAESLARLGAVSSLPSLREALKGKPRFGMTGGASGDDLEFYRAALNRAISALEARKQTK